MSHNHFLNGTENFTFHDDKLPYTVQDYWTWAFSDLYNNTFRGILAEYIVATALEIAPPLGSFQRIAWNPFDLLSKHGKRIEVKSAAYLQSWDGDFSKILFGIAPTKPDNTIHNLESIAKRHSDIYVFCLFTAKTRKISPLNLDYWEFYVLPTKILDDEKPLQKTISLPSLEKLNPAHITYNQLQTTINNY